MRKFSDAVGSGGGKQKPPTEQRGTQPQPKKK